MHACPFFQLARNGMSDLLDQIKQEEARLVAQEQLAGLKKTMDKTFCSRDKMKMYCTSTPVITASIRKIIRPSAVEVDRSIAHTDMWPHTVPQSYPPAEPDLAIFSTASGGLDPTRTRRRFRVINTDQGIQGHYLLRIQTEAWFSHI